MYNYIKGMITDIGSNYIVIENNGIGYLIYVSNPYAFSLNENLKVYLYQQIREDANILYGFKTKEEKELFEKLILVKGIGCKSAIGILATGEVDAVTCAIEEGNVNYLKKIPGIGQKAASQIILDLQGKLDVAAHNSVSKEYEEAVEVLIALGYKKPAAVKALSSINESLDTNGYVKKALSILVK